MFFTTNKSKNTFSQTIRNFEIENEKDNDSTIFEIFSNTKRRNQKGEEKLKVFHKKRWKKEMKKED